MTNILHVLLHKVSLFRLVRKTSPSKVHGEDTVIGRQGRGDPVPTAAVGGQPVDTENRISFSFPERQLDFNSVSFGAFHGGFYHELSPTNLLIPDEDLRG